MTHKDVNDECLCKFYPTISIILLCNILLFITNIAFYGILKTNKKKNTRTIGCQKNNQDISIIVNPNNRFDIITPFGN